MPSVSRLAPAKINTILRVTGVRPDGYHMIETVMVPLAFGDTITVSTQPAEMTTILVECNDPALACDETNLCYRAASILLSRSAIPQAVSVYIDKQIPVGAGLGGGSSDAAAVMLALNELWGLGLIPAQTGEYGVRLGADVPFFCHGMPAFCAGIGDRVTPFRSFPKMPILLVNPGFHLPTPAIYNAYDQRHALNTQKHIEGLTPPKPRGRCPKLFEGLQEVAATLENDLQGVAEDIHPVIRMIREELRRHGAVAAQMSGSGPTVFGVFENEGKARVAAQEMSHPGWKVIVTETIVNTRNASKGAGARRTTNPD